MRIFLGTLLSTFTEAITTVTTAVRTQTTRNIVTLYTFCAFMLKLKRMLQKSTAKVNLLFNHCAIIQIYQHQNQICHEAGKYNVANPVVRIDTEAADVVVVLSYFPPEV